MSKLDGIRMVIKWTLSIFQVFIYILVIKVVSSTSTESSSATSTPLLTASQSVLSSSSESIGRNTLPSVTSSSNSKHSSSSSKLEHIKVSDIDTGQLNRCTEKNEDTEDTIFQAVPYFMAPIVIIIIAATILIVAIVVIRGKLQQEAKQRKEKATQTDEKNIESVSEDTNRPSDDSVPISYVTEGITLDNQIETVQISVECYNQRL